MNLEEKVRLAGELEALGVNVIEAGFPVTSEGDFAAVEPIAQSCRGMTVASLCRTTTADILKVAESLRRASDPRIRTFNASSDIHLKYKLKKSHKEVLQSIRSAVRLAYNLPEKVELSAEDATRSYVSFLCEVLATAVDEGANIINRGFANHRRTWALTFGEHWWLGPPF